MQNPFLDISIPRCTSIECIEDLDAQIHEIPVFRTNCSLCNEDNDRCNFTMLDKTWKDVAIMLPASGCGHEEKAKNAINFYQRDDLRVPYVIFHSESTPDGKSATLKINNEKTVSLVYVSDKIASTLTGIRTRVDNKSIKSKVFVFTNEFFFSILVTFLSLIITGAVILYFWGDFVSIEVRWHGIDLIYHSAESPAEPKKLMTEEQVLNFPEITYMDNAKGGDSFDEENPSFVTATCSICIEDFQPGEKVRVTPCGHHYHTECIMPWLTTKSADCPVCKKCFVVEEVDKKDC